MLKHVDPLIGAEHQFALAYGDAELSLGQCALDVGGHVIRPFGGMPIKVQVLRNELIEECLEIPLHVWINVFLNQD